jgi:hypothetical protein
MECRRVRLHREEAAKNRACKLPLLAPAQKNALLDIKKAARIFKP